MHGPVSILLIEDDEMDADTFLGTMKQISFLDTEVSHCQSVEEALQLIELKPFHIIFTDLSLPDAKGTHSVRRLFSAVPHVPILALTGNDDPDLVDEILSEGGQDCLVKDVLRPDSIGRVIKSAILRKKTEQQLVERAEREAIKSQNKTDYISRMSHEIRTPLNAILGFNEVLQKTSLDSEQTKYVTTISQAGKNLLGLINNILDVSKIEAGSINLERLPVNLGKCLDEVIALFETSAARKKIPLFHSFRSNDIDSVIGDPVKLKQILINLIGNSMKFTESGSVKVHLELNRSTGSKATLLGYVEDSGIGMSPDALDRIFTFYQQEDASIEAKYGGTGLGLGITKKLIELMGGKITAESQKGVGSKFSFSIPFEISRKTAKGRLPIVQIDGRLEGRRLLLAEDTMENIALIKAFLKGFNLTLDVAENGKVAAEKATSAQYDLILMDIQMPVVNGLDATQMIRKHERDNNLPTVPIVALTADALRETKQKVIQAGCNMHLSKPIQRKNFVETLSLAITDIPTAALSSEERSQNADFIRDLVPGYLRSSRERVLQLMLALERSDLEDVRAIAHRFSGTGASYGFPRISEIGDSLQAAAKHGERSELAGLVQELKSFIEEESNRIPKAS